MSLIHLLQFDEKGDNRGKLTSLESMKNIPFEIKRVYYITGLDSEYPRGFHAHKKLKQIVICLNGKCRLVLDNGFAKEEVWLQTASKGLLITEMVWREMYDFSKDCVLMVLANEYYDEQDYFRDYDDFIQAVLHA